MAYADNSTYFGEGDSTLIGAFREQDFNNLFEFSSNPQYVEPLEDVQQFLLRGEPNFTRDYPHLVWVMDENNPMRKHDQGFRYARVMKTRAHVIVDEDENGPVVEIWKFKQKSKTYYTG